MKIALANTQDINGGAARAAYRLHHALRRSGVDSTMIVNDARAGDWTVRGPENDRQKLIAKLRPTLVARMNPFFKTGNLNIHSPAILPSSWPRRINASDAEVAHLQWVQGEMMSVEDIGRIRKPLVWTLHDMWAFCGAEHYTEDFRWRDGYTGGNRPSHESGWDMNRWVWNRKRRAWKRPIHIVTPSRWLADCARQSVLMRDWPVSVIPNPIDTDAWQPIEKKWARRLLQLPSDVPLLAFGALGGERDPRKGFDLLQEALRQVQGLPGLQLIVFGQLPPCTPRNLGFPIHYTGHLHDDLSLRALYSAADAVVVPSRQENLVQTAVEAHACGTPVIAFDTSGLRDIVTHRQTGYLAAAFDPRDMAQGIQWVIEDAARHAALCRQAREDAVAKFSYPVVADQYKALYARLTECE